MLPDGFLRRTGQAPIFWLSLLLMVAGTAVAIAVAVSERMSSDGGLMIFALAMTCALAATVLPWRAIRCPKCRRRWLWQMATTESPMMIWSAYIIQSCPLCGFDGRPRPRE